MTMLQNIEWTPADMVEVKLTNPDNFLKVRETLTRIGVSSRTEKKLWQSCHILHKKGAYYIAHFKELYCLDNNNNQITVTDIARRNTIVQLLVDWGLIELVDATKIAGYKADMSGIKIVPFRDKKEWVLEEKYAIGKRQ